MASNSIERERSPVAVLLNPRKDIPSGETDIRVEDYLNDKIQTATDLGNISSLLASVQLQQKQLQTQLQDAKSELNQARETSLNRGTRMLEQTQAFERGYLDVQDRLQLITSSDTPEDAKRRFEKPMEKLRKVELAQSYVALLQEAELLKKEAKSYLPENPKEALKPYMILKERTMILPELQELAEGGGVHLVKFMQETTDELWIEMKKIMLDEFDAVLKRSNWPDATSEPTGEWSDCLEKLLEFQMPEIIAAKGPLVLLPMEVLAKPFVQQFKYHFFSDKPTNNPNQLGNYYLEWFLGTVSKWQNFLRENIGPLLAAHFKGNIYSGNALYVDPIAAFVTALLPVMKAKVDAQVEAVANSPQLLSRFMVQLMNFDETVRKRFNYDGGNPDLGWKGLTWEVLDRWFDTWYEVEKKFALDRYRDINKSPDSGVIDYDSSGPGKTKPTYGAVKVTDLIQTETLQYNKLRKFSHKMKFLIGIQAEILDLYYGRLKDSLDIYGTITSTVGRTIHGITKEQEAALQGVGKFETLCKVFGSAEHLISMMKDWSNEEFFIDMWEDLQERAKDTTRSTKLAGEMSYKEVRDSTSDAMGSESEGAVFDKTIESFEKLRETAEAYITQAIKYSFPVSFKQYITKPQWCTIGDASPSSYPSARTAELDGPLRELAQSMEFLSRVLADSAFRRIWREALGSLQDLIFNDVLLKQEFTSLGSAQFKYDFEAIQSTVARYIKYGNGSTFGMPKLREAIFLLSLPVDSEGGQMSLSEVSEQIFAGGQRTSDALESLELKYLTNAEARTIMAKRLEANND
ncbi:related to Rad50-interacting protein 1 [Rhynchosporium secalis]|uniref:Related to Rad50-interacting protein 1 n=1 Tax=Rhynchosporium secalis TaxID=38038 RepID=A0A1E1M0S3_RHYSE|nr:related to Rad50-interacting protein 1 [Rhynchosporium secalis]